MPRGHHSRGHPGPKTLKQVDGNTQLTFPVRFSKFWDLRTSSRLSQPNFRLRFLSRGCASTNDVCKLRIHVLKTTKGQEQNYESIRPNYEKVLDCSQSHTSKLRIRNSHETTKLAGVQYAACPVKQVDGRSRFRLQLDFFAYS